MFMFVLDILKEKNGIKRSEIIDGFREHLPLKASSGKTRTSKLSFRFFRVVSSLFKRVSARWMLPPTSPSRERNWSVAIFIACLEIFESGNWCFVRNDGYVSWREKAFL